MVTETEHWVIWLEGYSEGFLNGVVRKDILEEKCPLCGRNLVQGGDGFLYCEACVMNMGYESWEEKVKREH